jgi:hypothetical protein
MNKPLTAIFVAVMLQSNISQVEIRPPSPIDVSLLDLQEHADTYNNCRIRVRGEYLAYGQHGIVMRDAKTGNILVDILLEYRDDSDVDKEYRNMSTQEYLKLVSSGDLENALSGIPWLTPLPVRPLPAIQRRAVYKKAKQKDDRSVDILVVGRFDYTKAGRLLLQRNGTVSFSEGFGSAPTWSDRIVVESIYILKETK